ncbi:MAG: hypothetical protein QM756_27095 [Polyangiaceae bacterium]
MAEVLKAQERLESRCGQARFPGEERLRELRAARRWIVDAAEALPEIL